MDELLDDEALCQQIEEEKLLKDENIPGLTICGQEHELEFLQQLSEHFDNLNKPSDSEDEEGEIREKTPDEAKETETERQIRLGEMTPFGTVLKSNNTNMGESQITKYLQQQEELKAKYKGGNTKMTKVAPSHKNSIPKKKRKKIALGTETVEYTSVKNRGPMLSERMTVDFNESSGSEYVPSSDGDSEPESEPEVKCVTRKRSFPTKKKKRTNSSSTNEGRTSDSDTPCSSKSTRIKVQKELDDGDEEQFERRINEYEKSFDPKKIIYYEDEDHFKMPLEVWSKLYNYQKVGVQWLWELHQQGVGGILADEMGLGKTIQLITFLSGLFYSKLMNRHTNVRGLGPVLIVCPTTLMYQWVKEFHAWFPIVRVAIFHACGSGAGRKKNLIKDVWRGRGVLITSYSGMMQHSDELLRYNWHYAILDEGHKIRNPDAKVTLAVKQLKTPHRIILSGSPLQNNLEELWSLFDFIYPGKLGALPMFQAQFAVPITHGGYANATDTEVSIAYKCASVLKEQIKPYLLRRTKTDVKSHIKLPEKNEQILFCQLTDEQRNLYKGYIDSGEVQRIIEGQAQIFAGIINLRKICNHPDLYTGGPKLLKNEKESDLPEEERFGFYKKSGKMIVLETLLKIWHRQKHKVLLFTQSKKMLVILEIFLKSFNYTYLKLDGGTYIGSRQPLIDQFNKDPEYFIMLLTTKVGGLGVNLTGANRIVIFDPDWNPATDTQARERAWRIGQTRDVTIYRFISVGTIEEKMYHRQIFKQFLTNKVLKDPKQRRFFKSNDLFELFTLKESSEEGSTETGAIFAGTGSEINKQILAYKQKLKKKRLREKEAASAKMPVQFSKSKIEKMKLIAQQISQKLTQQATQSKPAVEKTYAAEVADEKQKASRTEMDRETTNVKHHHQKKKKHRKSLFEGERVPYLVSCKKAKAKVETEDGEGEVKAVEDEYVLKKLFSKAGICSALQHDTIMNGGPADFAIVEKEAEKIADEAIKELKRSQEECFSAQTGIPNWTGKNGILAKSQRDKKALSSNDVLAKIKKRNGMLEATTAETQLLKDLRNFIRSEGGTASTDRLVQTFQRELPVSQTPLFKCLLNKVCKFYRGPDKKGYWTMKAEFLS